MTIEQRHQKRRARFRLSRDKGSPLLEWQSRSHSRRLQYLWRNDNGLERVESGRSPCGDPHFKEWASIRRATRAWVWECGATGPL